jgi:menaquinone-dependent protoporphyrinogen oxidase
MHVLVAFGSKRGGTQGLATMIGDALTEAGCQAIARRAADVGDLAGIDAVIVAGALYANRWHRDARRFVRRNDTALRALPVMAGQQRPLDDSATQHDTPPTSQVKKLAARVGARGHVTFGGRPGREGISGERDGQDKGRRLARPRARAQLDRDRGEPTPFGGDQARRLR